DCEDQPEMALRRTSPKPRYFFSVFVMFFGGGGLRSSRLGHNPGEPGKKKEAEDWVSSASPLKGRELKDIGKARYRCLLFIMQESCQCCFGLDSPKKGEKSPLPVDYISKYSLRT
ncbi:MAG TPA: hypothetical protein PLQ86_12245, partial [Candidatus Aminicenantes bacterium]|nr:hypothetical protein [Candidatus Aminicenantes bacterium]